MHRTPPHPAVNVGLVHTTSRHLLMLLMQVPLERQLLLLLVPGPTLPVASQPLNGLQPLLVVEMSTQTVQVPALVLLMMASAPALKVVTPAPVPRDT